MNYKDFILALDIGTSFVKAALVSTSGAVVDFIARPIDNSSEKNLQKEWVAAVKESISQLKFRFLSRAGVKAGIGAVSICGNGPTLVSVSYDNPLDGKVVGWGEKVKSSLVFQGFYSTRLKLFVDSFPQEAEACDTVLPCPEYLVYLMTGFEGVVVPSEAYKPYIWSKSEIASSGFDFSKIPDFYLLKDYGCTVSDAGSEMFGLDRGVDVFCAGADYFSALIGAGCVSPGSLCDRAGTSEGLNLFSSEKIVPENVRVMPLLGGTTYNVSCIFSDSGRVFDVEPESFKSSGIFDSVLDAVEVNKFADMALAYASGRSVFSVREYLDLNGIPQQEGGRRLAAYLSLFAVAVARLKKYTESIACFSIAGGQGVYEGINAAKSAITGVPAKIFFNPSAEILGASAVALYCLGLRSSLEESSAMYIDSCRYSYATDTMKRVADGFNDYIEKNNNYL